MVTASIAVCALAVAALLISDYYQSTLGRWLAKPLASSCFIAAALAWGAVDSAYGRIVLLALALCWLGDVLLIPHERPRSFQLGIASFLLGHVALTLAFLLRSWEPGVLAVAAVASGLAAWRVLRWLAGHVPDDFRLPVALYVVVIAGMVAAAASTTAATGLGTILLGALMFAISDLSVARDRFVTPAFLNGAWGLPLYFAGQLVLASTVT